MLSAVSDYERAERLTDAQKVVLRAHDAFLTHPAGLGDDVRADLLRHFSPAQIVEIALKFLYWSSNRATVALGADAPFDPDRVYSYRYGEDGTYLPPVRA
jgi:alkylhydroperoxidase family enzyme